MRRSNTRAQTHRRLLSVLAVVAAVGLLAFAGVTAARYVMQETRSGIATAQDFYFTSDLLREESENAVYYIDPQAGPVSISLFNWEDSQRITSGEIAYTIDVTNGAATPSSGKLTGLGQCSQTVQITPASKEESCVVKVSTKPFSKTLTATFQPGLGNQYTVEDMAGNTAAVLTVTLTDSTKTVALTLPDGVIPDATDSRVASTGGGYTFTVADSGVYALVLLKTNTAKNLSNSGTPFANSIALTAAG